MGKKWGITYGCALGRDRGGGGQGWKADGPTQISRLQLQKVLGQTAPMVNALFSHLPTSCLSVCGSLFPGLPASTLPPLMPGRAPPCLPVSTLHCDLCCGTSELPKSLKSCGSSSRKVIWRPLLIHTHSYPLQAPEFSECEADGLLASCQADLMLHAQSQPGPKGTCVPRPVRSTRSLLPPFSILPASFRPLFGCLSFTKTVTP